MGERLQRELQRQAEGRAHRSGDLLLAAGGPGLSRAVAQGVQHGAVTQRARPPTARFRGRSAVVLVPQEAVVARASRETESGGWTNIRSGTVPAGRSVAAGANPPGAQPPPVPSLSRCRSPSHACCICCAFPRRDGIHGRGATVSSRLAGCRMREAGRLPEDLVRSLEPTDLSFEVLQALALLGRQTRSTSRFTLGMPYPVPERLRRARDLLGDRANPPTATRAPARARTRAAPPAPVPPGSTASSCS